MITRLKTPMTRQLEAKYIEFFCSARENGYSVEIAFTKAFQDFLSYVVDLLLASPRDTSQLGVAYDNIKQDKGLNEKCLNYYALTKCNKETQDKYMPLIMQ
jgi:hypothetical protein